MFDEIVKKIENNIGRKLSDSEKIVIIKFLDKQEYSRLTSKKFMIEYCVGILTPILRRKNTVTDIKQIQTEMIKSESIENKKDIIEIPDLHVIIEKFLDADISTKQLSKIIAPKSKIRYNYLMLDTDNCSEISNDRTVCKWIIRQNNPILQSGIINTYGYIRNITAARLGRVTVNNSNISDSLASAAHNRFGIGFQEFASQAILGKNNTRYQFVVFLPNSDTVSDLNYTLTPFFCNRGWFRFRNRFKTIDTLSMNITNLHTYNKFMIRDGGLVINGTINLGSFIGFGNVYPNPYQAMIYNPIDASDIQYTNLTKVTSYSDTINVILGGLNSGDTIFDATFNGLETTLIIYTGHTRYIKISNTMPTPTVTGIFNIIITVPVLERVITVLELLTEDENDSDLGFSENKLHVIE